MSKKPYVPLTIDRSATKAKLLNKVGEQKLYAKARKISTATLCRILLDGSSAYPYQIREKSKFQKILRRLKADGYLVELDSELLLDKAA